MGYGRTVLSNNSVFPTRVSADGSPEYKAGGVTLDWSTVTAASGNQTLPDGSVILDGQKYLRLGQVITKITTSEIQTVNLSGGDDPTAGTFAMTILGETITGIAFNVAAADLQTLIRALDVEGAEEVTVSKTGFVYTITFPPGLGNVAAITADSTGLTNAGTQTTTIATSTAGIAGGSYYGPYDPDATDGRATLTRGQCFILDETVLRYGAGSSMLSSENVQIGGAIEGGKVWLARILQSGAVTGTLALGPTKVNLLAAFPSIYLVE